MLGTSVIAGAKYLTGNKHFYHTTDSDYAFLLFPLFPDPSHLFAHLTHVLSFSLEHKQAENSKKKQKQPPSKKKYTHKTNLNPQKKSKSVIRIYKQKTNKTKQTSKQKSPNKAGGDKSLQNHH